MKSSLEQLEEDVVGKTRIERDNLLARVVELEADNAQLQKDMEFMRDNIPTIAQAMAYESLLIKYKELESILSAHKAALEKARAVLTFCSRNPNASRSIVSNCVPMIAKINTLLPTEASPIERYAGVAELIQDGVNKAAKEIALDNLPEASKE